MVDMKKYKEMDCPVCGEFYFSELTDDEIEGHDFIRCSVCGWINDSNQTQNPDSLDGANELSLNDYKKEYEKKKEEDPNYNYLTSSYVAEPHECPVCRKFKFAERGSFAVCPVCGWEDDELMEDEPDNWAGCSNDLCLNDFRDRYKSLCEKKKDYKYAKDGFLK